MIKLKRYILIMAFIIASTCFASAQNIKALQDEIRRAEQEIKINNELLNKTRKDQKLSESQLKLIRARIRNRQNIVSSLEKQITLINEDITTKNHTVSSLSDQLAQLKKEYADMLYTSYKNYKLNNFLVFLFASKDFNDATKRVAFMRRYNNMREKKAGTIDSLSKRLSIQITELDSKRTELDKTKVSRFEELSTLGKDETQYKGAVNQLKQKEGKLAREVRLKREQIEKAQSQIQRIIAEEARKSKSAKKTTAEVQYDTELSGRFDQNMGKLPYPIRNGVIIDRFGIHPHPTQRGLTVNNRGINIAGVAGAEVRCVFEGVVTRIIFLPGLNNSVMVRHGNFITVYSNLSTVSIKTGDKVALNQRLGNISSSDDDSELMMHFEIWKETTNLNPESWLRR